MKVAVLGTGYVGLVTGVCLADAGHQVVCIDRDQDKVDSLTRGESPIYEPGLLELLAKNRERISATTDTESAILWAEVIMIAVGTPFQGNRSDLSQIEQAAHEIGEILKECGDGYRVVVVKSTVPPGATLNSVKNPILMRSGLGEDRLGFCMSPEFLREGSAVADFQNPDRIVLGVDGERTDRVMRELFARFDTEFLSTNFATAEMIKLTANTFFALNISYANEVADICERQMEVDSEEVFHGLFLDKRISSRRSDGSRSTPEFVSYLKAGCGFGGSCFPKDVQAFAAFAESMDLPAPLIRSILDVNARRAEHVLRLGLERVPHARRIGVLGVAFKPDTDDIRESPGIRLAELALDRGLSVAVHDYAALANARREFGDRVAYREDPMTAVSESEVIFVMTSWQGYRAISDDQLERQMKSGAVLVDARSVYKDRPWQDWRIRVGAIHTVKISEIDKRDRDPDKING